MKSKALIVLVVLTSIAMAWGLYIAGAVRTSSRISELQAEITRNVTVATYKNNISLYQELIKLDGKNPKWYAGLADAYLLVRQYGNFENTCRTMTSTFPTNPVGFNKLISYYSDSLQHKKVVSFYEGAPKVIQANADFLATYQKSKWQFSYLGKSYHSISQFRSGVALTREGDVYGYVTVNGSEPFSKKFVAARPFIGERAAVFDGEEWFVIDTQGDRVLATNTPLEDLYSPSEGAAAAKTNGKYGFLDMSLNQYKFEFDFATSFYNGRAAVKKDGKWAIINNKLEQVTSFIYSDILRDEGNICSSRGVIWAQNDQAQYTMLDLSGKPITSDTFEDARPFVDDLAAVKKGGKWGFVNLSGKVVIDFLFDNAHSFSSIGVAPISIGGRWGYIDKNAAVVIVCQFDEAFPFDSTGVAVVKHGRLFRLIRLLRYS